MDNDRVPDRLAPIDLDIDPSTAVLLDAVIAMSSDLDLHSVLDRIILSACELTGARYGAVGIIGTDGTLVDFITRGIDDETAALIGDRPRGRGILGVLINHPEPLRLADLADDPRSFGLPPNHPPMRSFLGVPVRIRGAIFGNLYLTEKAGDEQFTRQDEVLVEALATAAGYVIENARAYGLSELRRQWLEASAELTDVLQPPIDYRVALTRFADITRGLTRARAVAFVTRGESGPIAALCASPDDELLVSEAATALLDEGSSRLNRMMDCNVRGLTGISVPVPAHLAGRGALVVFQDESAPILPEERELVASFAEQAALALDRAQAIDDRADLAVISDRERIARDLHDVVIQRLFATGLQLQGVALRHPEVAANLEAAVDALDQTVKDIRGTIFELQHRRSDSLRAEVRDIVREYVGVLGFTPTVRTHGPVDTGVPDAVRDHLLSVLREAVSNLSRHAMADAAEIELVVTPSELRLQVSDDGVGPKEDAVESGLRNARRRAAELGGSFELNSREPRGTSFVWRVPLS